jgi:hypothetical protein
MFLTLTKTDPLQSQPGWGASSSRPSLNQRKLNVADCGGASNQVKGLEYEPDLVAANLGQPIVK